MDLIKIIKPLLVGLGALIYGILCFLNGSAKQKNKQLEQEVKNANEQKKRQFERDLDSDDVVRKRMQEFTRK
jgi:hypothetical protein